MMLGAGVSDAEARHFFAGQREEVREDLERALAPFHAHIAPARVHLVKGDPRVVIGDFATSHRIDLLVMLRDVLVSEVPAVLRGDVYAVAALAGAAVVVVGRVLQFPPVAVTIVGAVLCFGLRFMAIQRGWQLPVARLR